MWTLWEEPIPDESYVIGADVSEGISTGDFSTAEVLKQSNLEQVAEFKGLLPPTQFAEKLLVSAEWYNDAVLGVEANNHGIATVVKIEESNYPFAYYRQSMDRTVNRMINRIGWYTDKKTKPVMIQYLEEMIRRELIILHSKDLMQELNTYVLDDAGKTGAQAKCHDDLVIALAIALQMHKHSPQVRMEANVEKFPTESEMLQRHIESFNKPKENWLTGEF